MPLSVRLWGNGASFTALIRLFESAVKTPLRPRRTPTVIATDLRWMVGAARAEPLKLSEQREAVSANWCFRRNRQ